MIAAQQEGRLLNPCLMRSAVLEKKKSFKIVFSASKFSATFEIFL